MNPEPESPKKPEDAAMAGSEGNGGGGSSEDSDSRSLLQSHLQSQSHLQLHPYTVALVAKWGKERLELPCLPPNTTIAEVKEMLAERTNVLPKRQKLVGLSTLSGSRVTDGLELSCLKPRSRSKGARAAAAARAAGTAAAGTGTGTTPATTPATATAPATAATATTTQVPSVVHSFLLVGTPEKDIFVDPGDRDQRHLPEVVDDFGLDFGAGSEQWLAHVATGQNLRRFTESTAVSIMHAPRRGKPLLVLDLDHTLLDFSRKSLERAGSNSNSSGSSSGSSNHLGGTASTTAEAIERMKRPYMDDFLARAYLSYDLVVWSQTSWRWLETKLIELGMLANPRYRFCFVLDKTSMFAVTSTARSGRTIQHYVKPLQIIWNKFPSAWGAHNTVHLDDLSRNFALNPANGLKVTAFYRKKQGSRRDAELLGLATYLEKLAREVDDFGKVEMGDWQDVVAGKKDLSDTIKKETGKPP